MNKIQRMQAVFSGHEADIVPAGFWFHYNGAMTTEEMASTHIDLYRKTDMDIVKIMQDYPYAPLEAVKNPSDWYKIKMAGKNSPEYKKLEEVLKRVVDEVGDEVMVFQTMFGPFKAAVMAYGDALVMEHAKADPKAVAAGVNAIAESLAEWTDGYLNAGASGIYYSAQFGEPGRFTEEEWSALVKPSDLKVLKVADERDNKYNILHICGEPEYDFKVELERFFDYTGDMVNWSVKDNHFDLSRGRESFKRPILGGLNNKKNIISGTPAEIVQEVNGIIDGFGAKNFMIGADCTVQGQVDVERIRIAVEAAHQYGK